MLVIAEAAAEEVTDRRQIGDSALPSRADVSRCYEKGRSDERPSIVESRSDRTIDRR